MKHRILMKGLHSVYTYALPVLLLSCILGTSGGCGRHGTCDISYAGPEATLESAITNHKRKIPMKEIKSGTWTPDLSDDEKADLFAIAQDTLEWCVSGDKEPFSFKAYNITPKLKEPTATFVTLHIGNDLRGCIGSLSPEEAMYLSIHNNAINAALRDPRFSPVRRAELPLIRVDISLLSPISAISSFDDFKVGQQGIILQKGNRRSVFLPEVAIEQGWTREDTLSHLSMKAGLPADGWKNGARFEVFESVVLSLD